MNDRNTACASLLNPQRPYNPQEYRTKAGGGPSPSGLTDDPRRCAARKLTHTSTTKRPREGKDENYQDSPSQSPCGSSALARMNDTNPFPRTPLDTIPFNLCVCAIEGQGPQRFIRFGSHSCTYTRSLTRWLVGNPFDDFSVRLLWVLVVLHAY